MTDPVHLGIIFLPVSTGCDDHRAIGAVRFRVFGVKLESNFAYLSVDRIADYQAESVGRIHSRARIYPRHSQFRRTNYTRCEWVSASRDTWKISANGST